MPRRARLTSIAAGLCGSFASRNNDLAGYWTIGILCSLAQQHAQSCVTLDLLASSMQPPSSDFAQVLADYRRLLHKLAGRSGVPPGEIAVASIVVDFRPPPWPRIVYEQPQWGGQFTVTVTIRAHGTADGIARHGGYCRPHDPDRERRRR